MLDKIFWKVSSAVSVITVFSLLAFFCVKNCQNIILFLKKVATVATLGPAFTQYWVVLSRLKSQGKQCYHFTECLHLGTLQFWSFDWEILLTNQNCRLLGCKHSFIVIGTFGFFGEFPLAFLLVTLRKSYLTFCTQSGATRSTNSPIVLIWQACSSGWNFDLLLFLSPRRTKVTTQLLKAKHATFLLQ